MDDCFFLRQLVPVLSNHAPDRAVLWQQMRGHCAALVYRLSYGYRVGLYHSCYASANGSQVAPTSKTEDWGYMYVPHRCLVSLSPVLFSSIGHQSHDGFSNGNTHRATGSSVARLVVFVQVGNDLAVHFNDMTCEYLGALDSLRFTK